MSKVTTKERLEKIKIRFKRLSTFFSILSILVMLIYPAYAIYTKKGNLYVNVGVFIVSLVYGILWLKFGSKKAHKIDRVYKYSRLFLKGVSLAINAYSIYITATNFNFVSVTMSILMGSFWILNLIFNALYDTAVYKFNKFVDSKKEEIDEFKQKVSGRIKRLNNQE